MMNDNRTNARKELPAGWRWARLGEVCAQDRQIIDPGTHHAAGRPYLSLEHIESNTGRILRHPSQALENEGQSTTFAFDSRHVLYGKLRPYLNKVALPGFAGRCTTELIPLLPSDEMIREFLVWILRRQETVDIATRGRTGSRMPRADMGDLLSLEIPLPPLATQREIARQLERDMAEVTRLRAAAERQRQAAAALPSAYLREVFESVEARGWPVTRLGEILRLRKDIVHPYDNPTGPAVFVGLEHIESHTGCRIGSLNVDMSTLSGRKPRFFQGDIVYGYLRPYLNKVWLAEFDGLCSVDQYVYSVNLECALTQFIAAFLRSPIYLKRAPIDTTPGQLPRIRTEEVASVELALPSLSEQYDIVQKLEYDKAETTQIRNAVERQRQAIDAMQAALLREVFGGFAG